MDINHDTKKLFMYAILCLSLAVGLSSGVFSNYFKEVFAVDSVQRGLLVIPRETPMQLHRPAFRSFMLLMALARSKPSMQKFTPLKNCLISWNKQNYI